MTTNTILICVSIFFAILAIYAFVNRKKANEFVQIQNEQLKIKQIELQQRNSSLTMKQEALQSKVNELQNEASALQQEAGIARAETAAARKELDAISESIKQVSNSQKELAENAFLSYCETLEAKYCQIDNEFNVKKQNITSYLQQEQNKLDEIKATRAAAQEALLKEQEVKENKDNYRLIPSTSDLEDIQALERVRRVLHKPRVLSMLIWSSFWQPLAKVKFPLILQAKTRCGIYKITNIQTNECYIGQSLDIYKRWNDHCKCGLGIDTPPGNKLYKAMLDFGLENFTFELLAECPKEELDSKEKYFIELYQAKDFGYNGNTGVKK